MTAVTRVAVCQLAGRTLVEATAALAACRALVAEAARAGAEVAVLPEGAYPAYVLGSAEAARAVLHAGPDPIGAFGDMAREGSLTLVAGIVLDGGPAGLRNAAVAFSPDGSVLGSAAKRFLWHFDASWFSPGDDSPVWTSPVGRLGALVCADARLLEIPRTLAVRGAALVCDPTAWVTSHPGAPHNPQPDFLLPARALENGVAIAAASKCGFEGDAVAYAGRSMVVGPDGRVLAEAGVDGECVVVADVDLSGLPRLLVARRPELYGRLAEDQRLPPPPPSAGRVRVAAANGPEAAEPDHLAALAAHGVGLVAVPTGDLAQLARASGLWVTGPSAQADGGAVASPSAGVVARFPQVHGARGRECPPGEGAAADSLPPPVPTPAGRIAVLCGPDVLVPEQARVAALEGAEVLVALGGAAPLSVLRTRAAENRVFVVAPGPDAVVVGPSGAVLADSPADRPFLCAADCFLPEAADKAMAPGTDVFAGRQPNRYRELLEVNDSAKI